MKYHVSLVIAVFITVLNIANGLIRNSANKQSLSYINNEFQNVDTCEMQTMAKEMIEVFLKEKDLFTSIMETLQNRVTENSLCADSERLSVCKKDTDDKETNLQCTSEEYENLVDKFTHNKLCHSQIAFENVLLRAFIDKDESRSAFNTILNNFNVVAGCVDDELKDIYVASIKLITDLRNVVVDVSEKLWSNKIIDVLKKREYIIAGIFCELRKGKQSELLKNSMLLENVGIIKLNDSAILNDAFNAFYDYYYYIPYFATKLLEKKGLVDRLIEIHEKLTTYRAKHLVNRLNEQSKDSVLINKETSDALNNYKHHQAHKNTNKKSFLQKSVEADSSNTKSEAAESTQNTNNSNNSENAKNKNKDNEKNLLQDDSSSTQKTNNNDDKNETQKAENNVAVDNDKKEDPSKNVESNNNNNSNADSKGKDNSSTDVNKASDTKSSNAKNSTDKNSRVADKTKTNPLYSIESLQENNVYDLLKGLIKDLNIVKFENDEPTNYTDNEQIKKLIEDNFFDLNNSTMLVRLLLKPQVVILSSIQSFILMTPSPDKDARMYCKKTLKNGTLIDGVNLEKTNEEEDLVAQFASKYNAVYEKIKLEEMKEIDESNSFQANKTSKVSALQIKNDPDNTNIPPTDSNGQSSDDISNATIAIVGDGNGADVSKIVETNVNVQNLFNAVDKTYQKPGPKSNSIHMSLPAIIFACVLLFLCF